MLSETKIVVGPLGDKGIWEYYRRWYELENRMWEIRSAKYSALLCRKNGVWPEQEFVDLIHDCDELLRDEQHQNMMVFMKEIKRGYKEQ